MVNMSQVRVRLSSFAFERLSTISDISAGEVYGVVDNEVPLVLGFVITSRKYKRDEELENSTNEAYNYDLVPNLPGNCVSLGLFVTVTDEKDTEWNEYLNTELKTNHVLLTVNVNTHTIIAELRNEDKIEKIKHEVLMESYLKNFVHLNLTGSISLSCSFDYDSVQESMQLLSKKIDQGVAFQLRDTKIYLLENGASGLDISNKADIAELMSVTDTDFEPNKCENNKMLTFSMFLKSYSESSGFEIAPVIKYVKRAFKCAKINLPVNALALVNRKTKVHNLYKILLESLRRNIKLNEDCLLKQFKNVDSSRISLPQIYHFFPKKCGHFILVAYPKKEPDDQLIGVRETFHKVLSLPMDIPIFRKANVFVASGGGENQGKILTNPHEGLKPSGVSGGEVSLVQGVYGYHHYMQDGFDDNGWGCAYRSLQTIFSWFRHQGLTGKPIPSHRDIQQCLVNIGDKPSSFVGSKNWIGSTEVSFVLDTLLGVSSRILSVSSGEEMSMKGGELSHHFKTQGTPIMIGGGVLAHTILGVDYNRKTGSLKFLILDPHYTGGEDLDVIQSKGWCGWKGLDFWKKNAFYNMCLPQRPKSI